MKAAEISKIISARVSDEYATFAALPSTTPQQQFILGVMAATELKVLMQATKALKDAEDIVPNAVRLPV